MKKTAIVLFLLCTGCSLKIKAPEVELPIPDAWAFAASDASAPPALWWQGFGSPELDRLVVEALGHNPDLNIAAARLRQAEARLVAAGGGLWPRLGLSVESTRQGATTGGGAVNAVGAMLSASYELDLWGALRAGRSAASATRDAALFQQDTVRTTIVSAVVDTYLRMLGLRERIQVAQENLANAEQVLEIVQVRYRNGATSALALAQQQGQVAAQRAELTPLEQQEREATAALALLVGRAPQDFRLRADSFASLATPQAGASLPASVLARRPDVRRAEAALHAARAEVTVARAALFPQLTLSGGLSLQSTRLGSLLDAPSRYALAASLVQTLFQGGTVKALGDAAVAFYEELTAEYVDTVLKALAEADLALASVHSLEEQFRWQAERVEQALRAHELARVRYRAGSEDLLTVLDAQRTLFAAQDQKLRLRQAQLQSLVTLYRSLGAVPPAKEDLVAVES